MLRIVKKYGHIGWKMLIGYEYFGRNSVKYDNIGCENMKIWSFLLKNMKNIVQIPSQMTMLFAHFQ